MFLRKITNFYLKMINYTKQMENKSIDIINLIEKNPIVQLSSDYQNKFITKIKNNFNEEQQKLFVSSFYIYLNYNSKTDFVIEFDSVWKWLGFSRKDHCKVVLEKFYKNQKLLPKLREQKIN